MSSKKTVPMRLDPLVAEVGTALLNRIYRMGSANLPEDMSPYLKEADLSGLILGLLTYTTDRLNDRKGDDGAR